jgi:hypothetical protein
MMVTLRLLCWMDTYFIFPCVGSNVKYSSGQKIAVDVIKIYIIMYKILTQWTGHCVSYATGTEGYVLKLLEVAVWS